MAKIALMALGQVVGSDVRKSISALAKLSAKDSWVPFYSAHWVITACKLQYDTWFGGNIAKYKKGEMTTPEFIEFLRAKISAKATDQELKDAWNAMCEFSKGTKIKEIGQYMLANPDLYLVTIGVTNELHAQYLQEQLNKMIEADEEAKSIATQNGIQLRVGKTITSYEEKTLDVKALVNKALSGFDDAANTIYTFIHTVAAIPSMGIQKAKIEMCQFDKNKTFAEMLEVQNSGHQKSL